MSSDKEIFLQALERSGAERAAFLAEACPGDAAGRARIEALLENHERASGFLREPLVSPRDAGPRDLPAETIGRYKLLEKIGEGGCGVVYLAEQQVPVRRRVALKVIKLGMDTNAVIARFEAERQALALMDHPNIAKVFDAGAAENGRPYFVMELVRGIPLTTYCDQARLTPTQRLELMIAVCAAIQHAHQKGIVHRDLKPSNILVTLSEGVPVPKVIDFGVAKATQGRLTDHTLHTAVEQFIGTPVYMSPDQADLSGLDVDSRSDIYSLGVLLYELLAGHPPFDAQTFARAGVDAIRRQIREVEPPKPSIRFRTLTEVDRATVARSRGTAPAELSLLLRGDLDWIVMRCLEKDRTRRYPTASTLALDLQHHLRHEPVSARPPSPLYLLGKLIRRRRTLVVAVGAVTVALSLGFATSIWWLQRAERSRPRASLGPEAPPPSPVNQLLAQARVVYGKVSFTRDDLAAAEDLTRRAVELDSGSAAAWGLRARVQALYLVRSWDHSARRVQDTQLFANRSLAMDPNEADALYALALVMDVQANESAAGTFDDLAAQAGVLARRAVKADPDDTEFVRGLARIVARQGHLEEARAILRAAIKRNGRDPLLHYDLAINYANSGDDAGASPENLAEALKEYNAALSIAVFASPLIHKAVLLVGWRGDLGQMQGAVDQLEALPLADRADDRAVWLAMWAGILERRPERTFRAAGLTADDYFIDTNIAIAQPKGFMLAEAYLLAGETSLAQQEWRAAEAVLRGRMRDQPVSMPGSVLDQIQLAIALEQMNRLGEAAAMMAPAEPVAREGKNFAGLRWWTARYYALRGDPAAFYYLKRSINSSALVSADIVRLDPIFDPLRAQPGFEAVLNQPVEKK